MKQFRISSNDGFKIGGWKGTYHGITIEAPGDIEVSDEYHSMHHLYKHRMALNMALFNMIQDWLDSEGQPVGYAVMKSKQHADGTMFDGYFIVMAITPHGQISYHYKLKHWDKFRIPEVERTPTYDGHSSEDAIARLMAI